MIERHGKCIGIKLFRWGRRQLELWFCPGGEVIGNHVHKNINVDMMILGGRMFGKIGSRSGPVGWDDLFRVFRIPAGVEHDAVITGKFCLFLSFETWEVDEVTSAAIDFVKI